MDSGIEANLISQGYSAQLPLKILDTFRGLATINKQRIRTQKMIIAIFKMSNSVG